MTTPSNVLLVALGGAAGALARWGAYAVGSRWSAGLPVGTWGVNALGCLLVGVVLAATPPDRLRFVFVVGFLGSFTTFSTYSADTVALWLAGRPGLAVVNAVGTVVIGLVCTVAGLAVGRAVFGAPA